MVATTAQGAAPALAPLESYIGEAITSALARALYWEGEASRALQRASAARARGEGEVASAFDRVAAIDGRTARSERRHWATLVVRSCEMGRADQRDLLALREYLGEVLR